MPFYDYEAGQDVQGSAVSSACRGVRLRLLRQCLGQVLLSPPNREGPNIAFAPNLGGNAFIHDRGSMKGFRKRWARATTDDAAEELEDDACARSTAGDPIVELGDGSLPPSLQWSPGAEPGESVCPNEPEASLGSWVEVSIDSEETSGEVVVDQINKPVNSYLGGKRRKQTTASLSSNPIDLRTAIERTNPVKIVMPWERGVWGSVFGSGPDPYKPMASTLTPASLPPKHNEPVVIPKPISLNQRRLRAANLGPPEDDRVRATQRFKVLILLDPSSTRAGKQMTDLIGRCSDEQRALQVLTDILAPKATGTPSKRAGALWRYAAFLANRAEPSPFCAREAELYQYLQLLRSDHCTSTASSLLEALRFAHGMFGFLKVTLAELDSPRVRGAAHSMFVQKRVRMQAPALPIVVILKLIELAADEEQDDHISLIAGQLLACVFGVGRWSDFRAAHSLEIDQHDGVVVWSMHTSEHKTATTKEAKRRLLPFVGLGHWPHLGCWVDRLRRLRELYGVDAGLPAWDHSHSRWHAWPMSSSEATAWLREFAELAIQPEEAQQLRSHSCKHTLLNWAGGSGMFTREERTMLGHHVEASTKSATTYDKNAMLALQAKVLRMITAIQEGTYDSDASMAYKLRALANTEVNRGPELRQAESLFDDSAERASSSSEDDGGADPKEVFRSAKGSAAGRCRGSLVVPPCCQ